MKNKIKIFILAAALGMTACNYLDTMPDDAMTGDHFWKIADDAALQQYCNGYYPKLIIGFGQPKGWNCGDMFEEEYKSDNVYYKEQNLYSYGQNIIQTSDPKWDWKVIRGCNAFIENYQKSSASEAGKANTVGQMYFFKAWDYFNKVVAYGDVPWYDTGSDKNDPSLYKGRDSRILVMKNIVNTLDLAIENLPLKKEVYRVSKDAAICLKARVCLFEGTWRKYHGIEGADEYLQLAYNAACELMKPTYGYSLYTAGGPEHCYFDLFVQPDYQGNPEIILSRQYEPSIDVGHDMCYQMPKYEHGMSRDCYEEYLCSNTGKPISMCGCHNYKDGFLKETAHRDLRLSQSICIPDPESIHHHFLYQESDKKGALIGGAPNIFNVLDGFRAFNGYSTTGYAISKFYSAKEAKIHFQGTTDAPVMRYAEVLLIRAEAAAELGTITQEDLDLTVNALRKRVGFNHKLTMDPIHDPDLAAKYDNVRGNNPDLIREIRRERRVELFCEGYRWTDILRWKVGDQVLNKRERKGAYMDPSLYSAAEIEQVRKEVGLDADGFILPYEVKGKLKPAFTDKNYLLNIPTDEIALNPKLEQNPGWEIL